MAEEKKKATKVSLPAGFVQWLYDTYGEEEAVQFLTHAKPEQRQELITWWQESQKAGDYEFLAEDPSTGEMFYVMALKDLSVNSQEALMQAYSNVIAVDPMTGEQREVDTGELQAKGLSFMAFAQDQSYWIARRYVESQQGGLYDLQDENIQRLIRKYANTWLQGTADVAQFDEDLRRAYLQPHLKTSAFESALKANEQAFQQEYLRQLEEESRQRLQAKQAREPFSVPGSRVGTGESDWQQLVRESQKRERRVAF